MNSNITMTDVENNPTKPWVFDSRVGHESGWTRCSLASNPNLTMTIVNRYDQRVWNWIEISANPNITMDDVRNNSTKPWDYESMLENPNITTDMVIEHFPFLPINQESKKRELCANPAITIADMEKHYNRGWSWWYFSFNPNLTIDYIKAHINDIEWSCRNL
jgi:hypothetical protein